MMKNFIVYTTQGTTYGPNIDVNIENCQVLGIIYADSNEDAIDTLFEKNECINDAGFTKGYAVAKQLFSSSIKKDIKEIIDYLLEIEYKHCKENIYQKNHIFNILKRLKELV